jgi:alpha-ketoglutarate-dependent taurine dioxygenase
MFGGPAQERLSPQEAEMFTDIFASTAETKQLPWIIERIAKPEAPDGAAEFTSWFAAERPRLEEQILTHGAILFRGTGIGSPEEFALFMRTAAPSLLDYVTGNSPRTRIERGVYTSTEYPAPYLIWLHNEMSYSHVWPEKLFFCCVIAPRSGGETVVADSRELLRRLDPAIIDEFRRRGVMYIRNLHGGNGFGASWQDTFETTDRQAVERYCEGAGITYEWRGDGRLRISQVRPALQRHPRTGEEVWFNQADQFHPSTHPKEIFDSLMMVCGNNVDELPQNARFGDGQEIDLASLEAIRAVARTSMVPVTWQKGDLLMIDNILVAHGRMPFAGPRKILVAMC